MKKVKIYTTEYCSYCDRAKNILDGLKIAYQEINIFGNLEMREKIMELTGGRRDVPQIFIDDKYVGDDDDLYNLAVSGELDDMASDQIKEESRGNGNSKSTDILIIGSGPAGLTAALYDGRAELDTVVVTGKEHGGQISITQDIENYPGFTNGIKGPELVAEMTAQAERFGAKIVYDYVHKVDFLSYPFKAWTHDTEYIAKAVVISTGSSPRMLEIPGEQEYIGKGVSYCATCDGFFFKDKEIVVVGGGDAAVEEGMFLTRFATRVTMIHRRDRLRASEILQTRARKNDKIDFIWDTKVTEIIGDGNGVTSSRLLNVKTDEEAIRPIDGVFIFVGHYPNTEIFKGQIEMDEMGYIITDRVQHTNIEGVFAAGDVQDYVFRQAITAAGTGAAAAIEAEKFIAELENRAYPGR